MKKSLLVLTFASLILSINFSVAAIILPAAPAATSSAPYALNPLSALREAMTEFKNLSRKERKERVKEVKHSLKELKKQKKANGEPSTNKTLLIILAILLPPLAVYLHEGVINNKFWLDLVLTLLFFLPGVIYALIVVLNKD